MFPFHITYQLSAKSFLRLSFVNWYRHWSVIAISSVGLLFILFGLSKGRTFDIVVGWLFILMPSVVIIIRIFLIFKQFPYIKMPATYDFTDEFLLINQRDIETRIPWPRFKKIKYATGFMTIHLTNREGVILPVRLFEPEQLSAVQRKILREP